jgi:RND family efflux transporter MFP subunit
LRNVVLRIVIGAGCLAMVAPARGQVAKVETTTPERATVRRVVEQPGQVEAFETAPLHAKVAGYVSDIAVNIGDRVKKGQTLATVDVPELDAELARRKALLDSAEADQKQAEAMVRVALAKRASADTKKAEAFAGLRRADADLARWEAELARVAQLVRESAMTVGLLDETKNKQAAAVAARDEARARQNSAESGLVEADAGVDKARSDVAAAAARVEVERQEVKKADVQVAYTRIVAPFDGVVVRRQVDTGHLTRIGADGHALFTVARDDLVTIAVGVPEVAAPFVDKGDPVKARVPALGDRVIEGKVARTSYVLDPTTRTLAVEVDLPTADTGLWPGLYVTVSIVAEEHQGVWTVPATALVKEAGKTYCVVVEGDKARRREVTVGIVDGPRAEVVKGLEGREKVVKANAASLGDGQTVQVLEPAKSGAKP